MDTLLSFFHHRKKLENRLGVERNAAGHRFKLNRDMVGYFDSARQMGGLGWLWVVNAAFLLAPVSPASVQQR
jgi:hypothetical protein